MTNLRVLSIITVMRTWRSRFRVVRSQARAVAALAGVMLARKPDAIDLAAARRRLERELRDAGYPKAYAVRIAARTLRHFDTSKHKESTL